ncbi:MAG: hypothetical protein OHK0029_40270 [Armatimonadaceae bacterium]
MSAPDRRQSGSSYTSPYRRPIGKAEAGSPSLLYQAGWWLFLLALVLAPAFGGFPPGATYGGDVALGAIRCVVLLAGICLALASTTSSAEKSGGTVPQLLLWGAFGWTLLSLLVHSRFLTDPVLLFAMLPATLDWLCYAVLFSLAVWLARDAKNATFIAGALALGGAWAAVMAAMEYGQFVQNGFPGQRAQAPFFSPNFLAGYLGVTLPVVVALFLRAEQRLALLGLGVVAALMSGALIATGSRSGIVLAIGGIGAAFLLALVKKVLIGGSGVRERGLRILLLVVAAAVLAFAFRGPLVTRGEGGGQEHSGAFRAMTWQGTQAMAQANPVFGAGPGTFSYLYPRYAVVARTDLAHSSYLQLAAEQGFPTLILTILTLATALGLSAWHLLRHKRGEDTAGLALLACGLLGGVLVGAARSVFDSEWSLLGNGVPFWAAAGALVGVTSALGSSQETESNAPTKQANLLRFATVPLLLGGLALALVTLQGVQIRDGVKARLRSERPDPDLTVFPPDPSLLYWQAKPEEAARIEPTGKRFYQLGRFYEAAGETGKAIEALRKSVEAEPNSLQVWRKLAELQEASGDRAAALGSWQKLVELEEGPVGQNRAIPELREIHAAFAYTALARAARASDPTQAAGLYEKAATVIEEYSRTPPIYQQMEVASALSTGISIEERREEIRSLYNQIITEWSELEPARKAELEQRRNETIERLETFLKPEAIGSVAP